MCSVLGIQYAAVFVDEPITAEHILGERGTQVTGCSHLGVQANALGVNT
jgi:hypothetical protein